MNGMTITRCEQWHLCIGRIAFNVLIDKWWSLLIHLFVVMYLFFLIFCSIISPVYTSSGSAFTPAPRSGNHIARPLSRALSSPLVTLSPQGSPQEQLISKQVNFSFVFYLGQKSLYLLGHFKDCPTKLLFMLEVVLMSCNCKDPVKNVVSGSTQSEYFLNVYFCFLGCNHWISL